MRLRIVGILLLAGFCAMTTTVQGAAVSIKNPFLEVSFDSEKNDLVIKSAKTGTIVVSKAAFSLDVKSAGIEGVKDARLGKGEEIIVQHVDGSSTSIRLFDSCPFAHVHTSVNNPGKEPLDIDSLEILDMKLGLDGKKLMSYGTAGLKPVSNAAGSYAFHALADPETRNGVVTAWLTHDVGVGVFFPRADGDGAALKAQLDFGLLRVRPGKTRDTDTLLIGYFDDARLGLEGYADAVATHYMIKLKPKPGVYCTWYHSGASNEGQIGENTQFAAKSLKPFGLDVMQIDDKWQAILPNGFKHEGKIPTTGPIKVFVDAKSNYSKGMAHTAKNITSHGMVAGIWFMPFAGNLNNPYFDKEIFAKNADGTPFHDRRWSGTCIDMTNPKAHKFVYDRIKRIYDWGYRYFKIDGMHTGIPSYNIYVHTGYKNQNMGKAKLHDPHTTHVQAYRRGLETLREAAPGTFVLGCNVSQNMISMGPAFGLIDAMRIGPDNGGAGGGNWGAVTKGAWHGSNLYFLNGRIWYNDPDPVYVRPSNPVERARWMCSWLAMSGGMHTSSEQYSKLPEDRLDILQRCLPGHTLPARPADLFETDKPQIWLVQNERLSVVGLFNWHEKNAADISYDMRKLGLDGKTTYTAFDFWANKFVGPVQGAMKQTVPGGTCRILALKPQADHPQLLSTSRHITQGLIDVLEEKWDAGKKTLSGRSQVVGDDSYEMRIALPAGSSWKAKGVSAEGAEIKIGAADTNGVRVTIDTPKSADIAWSVTF